MEILAFSLLLQKKKTTVIKWFGLVITCLFLLLEPNALIAEEERQYKIEAAFLYNFFNYITWPGYTSPEELKDPTICIFNNDPVEPFLQYIQRKAPQERKLNIQELHDDQPADTCHILFTRKSIPSTTLRGLSKAKTLTVLMPEDTLDRGGMIELSLSDERIAMRINQSDMVENGFQISSRLLGLAERVR